MIQAKVIADSKNQFGNRLTTMIVTMPRYILAEFNTHRMLSKNSASSRAIPFEKLLKSVEENPFIPMAWQKDHKGMQGTEYITQSGGIELSKSLWIEARNNAIDLAKELAGINVTKQLCNRLLEPFMYHTVICSFTEVENFFALRCPRYSPMDKSIEDRPIFRSKKDTLRSYPSFDIATDIDWLKMNEGLADIHMMATAEAMWDAYNESTPKLLQPGEWHVPFGDRIEREILFEEIGYSNPEEREEWRVKIATARCARVSYTVVGADGKEHDYQKDIELHYRLIESGHMSATEHCAKAMDVTDYSRTLGEQGWSGNFRGFIQYRKMIPNEAVYQK